MTDGSAPDPIIALDHKLADSKSTTPGRQRHKMRILVWIAMISAFAVVFFLVLRHHEAAGAKDSKKAGGAVTVATAVAKKGDIGVYLDAIGTVTPVYTASITAEVGGVITDVLYKEGQILKKGDRLIEIDPRPYQATLLEAQGLLERDTNLLAQAQMDLARYRTASANDAISRQTLEDQEKIVLQDEGTVKNDQGAVNYDQIQLGFCHVTAPIPGRAGLRLVDPGNVVQSTGGTALAVITQMQPITAIFPIAEDSIGEIEASMNKNLSLTVDLFDRSGQKKIATGKFLALDNQIDTTTGTVKARALFDNADNALFPNQFVNVRLLVKTLQGATLVPASAVQHNGQTSFLYVVQENAVHLRNVKAGVTEGGLTQVDGINPGDVVADSSFDKLQDNAKVAVSDKDSPGSAPGGNSGESGGSAP